MQYYPITSQQEQELRERANQVVARRLGHTIEAIAAILGSMVFADGRLSNNVDFETRCRIAKNAIEVGNRQEALEALHITFIGVWHEDAQQRIKESLVDIALQHPRMVVRCTNRERDYKLEVWDGSTHLTVQPIEVNDIRVIANRVRWLFY